MPDRSSFREWSASTEPRFFGSLRRLLPFAVIAAAFGLAPPAQSASGDGGEASPFAASALCDGDQDVVSPCGADSEQCELTPNGGIPVGFCQGGVFDDIVREVLDGVLEADVTIDATSFGTITLLANSIVYCRTFAQQPRRVRGRLTSSGIKVCAEIEPCDGECPASPGSCSGFLSIEESTCVVEAEELAASLAPGLQPEDLAFVAGVDYERLAQTSSASLKVCSGHSAQCFDPASTLATSGKANQVSFSDIQTPGCYRIGGTRYCSPLR
jgi:hypothetical protein